MTPFWPAVSAASSANSTKNSRLVLYWPIGAVVKAEFQARPIIFKQRCSE